MIRRPPRSTRTDTLFPYTTLFRSLDVAYNVAEHRYEDTPQVYISSANLILLAIQNESLSDNVDLPATADIDVIAKWQYAAQIMASIAAQRSEERRVGKECVST